MDDDPTGGNVSEIAAEVAAAGLSLHTQPEDDGRFTAWIAPATTGDEAGGASFAVESVTRDTEVEAARAAWAMHQLRDETRGG